MAQRYTLREQVFGPRLTQDDVIEIELRATREGWYELLLVMLDGKRSARAKRFLLAHLRDGVIQVAVYEIDLTEDVYEDTDPYEGMGLR